MRRINFLFIVAATLLVATSCKKADKEQLQQVQDEATFDEQSQVLSERFDAIMGLTTTDDIGVFLLSTNLDFNEDWILYPELESEFENSSEEQNAVVLGIYYLDLRYSAAYQEGEYSAQIASAAASVSERIGLTKALQEAVNQEFADRIEGDPEAEAFVAELFADATKNLNTTNRPRLSALVVSGSFMERMYLLGKVVENMSESRPADMKAAVAQAVLDQEAKLDRLIEYVAVVRKPQDYSEFFRGLDILKEEFGKLDQETRGQLTGDAPDLTVLNPIIDVVNANRRFYTSTTPGSN